MCLSVKKLPPKLLTLSFILLGTMGVLTLGAPSQPSWVGKEMPASLPRGWRGWGWEPGSCLTQGYHLPSVLTVSLGMFVLLKHKLNAYLSSRRALKAKSQGLKYNEKIQSGRLS